MLIGKKLNKIAKSFFLKLVLWQLFFVSMSFSVKNVRASGIDNFISIIENLTCTTQGVGDMLRTEFSHTCIQKSFFDQTIDTVKSGTSYVEALLRLKINDDQLFPDGGCGRENRIDPSDLRIEFGMCSDALLTALRLVYLEKVIEGFGINIFNRDPVFSNLPSLRDVPFPIPELPGITENTRIENFHIIYQNRKPGDIVLFMDYQYGRSIPLVIPLIVSRNKDAMCISMISITGLLTTIGCQYIKEPYPTSIYDDFFGKETSDSQYMTSDISLTKCSAQSCYQRAQQNSKTLVPFTGIVTECIREMANRLLISDEQCTASGVDEAIETSSSSSGFFFSFQKNMQKYVTALLSLYVILSGFVILLKGELPERKDIFNFALKVILVTYFSVGLNINADETKSFDGVTQWLMPFLLGGIGQLASWIVSASPSELCSFDVSLYEDGFKNLALWDALDCRVANYIGIDSINIMYADLDILDKLKFSLPPYFYFLVPALYTGNIALVMLVIAYPMMVVSVVAYMVSIFGASIISITILSFLAPIFVPFILFQYTKKYFDSWIKLLISFMLQPMVVAAFIVMFFSVIDLGLYGKCKYNKDSFDVGDRNNLQFFYVNNDWSQYSEEDATSCKKSLGYILTQHTIKALNSQNKASEPKSLEEDVQSSDLKSNLKSKRGTFFDSFSIAFNAIKDFMLAMLLGTFILYLLKHISEQLSEFVADMVEGVPMNDIAIKPMTFYNGINKIAQAASNSDIAKFLPNIRRSGDKAGSSQQYSRDQISVGDNVSRDQISSRRADISKDLINTGSGADPQNNSNISEDKIRTKSNLSASSEAVDTIASGLLNKQNSERDDKAKSDKTAQAKLGSDIKASEVSKDLASKTGRGSESSIADGLYSANADKKRNNQDMSSDSISSASSQKLDNRITGGVTEQANIDQKAQDTEQQKPDGGSARRKIGDSSMDKMNEQANKQDKKINPDDKNDSRIAGGVTEQANTEKTDIDQKAQGRKQQKPDGSTARRKIRDSSMDKMDELANKKDKINKKINPDDKK